MREFGIIYLKLFYGQKDGLNCAKSITSLFLLIKRFQWGCNMVE